jgi:hypothetical protein
VIGLTGLERACMVSFRTVRVATAAVRPALAYSVTADRLGGGMSGPNA